MGWKGVREREREGEKSGGEREREWVERVETGG